MKRTSNHILTLLLLPAVVFGIERVGTTSFQFLKIPVGVRGIGMGNAFVAGAADASAVYWNPSGLGWATSREVLFTHINMPADNNYDNVAFVLPLSVSAGVLARIALLATAASLLSGVRGRALRGCADYQR